MEAIFYDNSIVSYKTGTEQKLDSWLFISGRERELNPQSVSQHTISSRATITSNQFKHFTTKKHIIHTFLMLMRSEVSTELQSILLSCKKVINERMRNIKDFDYLNKLLNSCLKKMLNYH